MKILFNDFQALWSQMPKMPNSFLEIEMSHPLKVRIGHNETAHKSLSIEIDKERKNIPSSAAISSVNKLLRSGKWSFELQLMDHAYDEEFVRLCWDILAGSQNCASEKEAFDVFIKKYLSWQKLLQYRKDRDFSVQQQKGLLGELLYLKELLDEVGISTAVEAWQGPEGSDQDFVLDTTWAEVKSVTLEASSVKISSMEQLQQEVDGCLVVYRLEKTKPGVNHINLCEVVHEIADVLSAEPELHDIFNMKLFKYGYKRQDESKYAENFFRMVERCEYEVNQSFPKITHKNQHVAVVACSYELSLAAIEVFRRS